MPKFFSSGAGWLRSFTVEMMLLLLALHVLLSLPAPGQTLSANANSNLYGGIEIGSKGVKGATIQVTPGKEGYQSKLIFGESINTTIMQTRNDRFTPEALRETSQAVQKLFTRMATEQRVPLEQLYIVGSSGLRAENQQELVKLIKEKTGKTMEFLTIDSEVELSIAGTIPRRYYTGRRWIDNRGASVLIDIGSGNTKGGYQVIRQTVGGGSDYDYVTIGITKGTLTFTNEVEQALGEAGDLAAFAQCASSLADDSVRLALRREMERKPGLTTRQRVYLTGGIVWAMTTLLHPDDRRIFVPLSLAEVNAFYRRATTEPLALLNPSLAHIRDPNVRRAAAQEIESVRNTFTPRNLIAGAEILKAIATEFNLQGKRVRFVRYGNLAWILSYVRLQVE